MDLNSFFENEVKPSLGCTEIGAAAYAAAAAAEHLNGQADKILLRVSIPIYKNGLSVGIPGTPGLKGLGMAAALGAVGGNPAKGLTALSDISETQLIGARALVDKGQVEEVVERDAPAIWIEAALFSRLHSSICTISHRHDTIERIMVDGQVIYSGTQSPTPPVNDQLNIIKRHDFASLWDLATRIDSGIKRMLLEGVSMNLAASERGLRGPQNRAAPPSRNFPIPQKNLGDAILQATAAASLFRMQGGNLPVMSSAGSGNHGITAIVPVALVARDMNCTNRQLAEAVALSHLVCGYLKAHMGRLTPTCGCAVAAGAGAAAAIVRLHQGTAEQAEISIATFVAALLGMICDGAKDSCALKVGVAGFEAYNAALLALKNEGVKETQGLVPARLPELGRMLEAFNRRVLSETNQGIVDLMVAQASRERGRLDAD